MVSKWSITLDIIQDVRGSMAMYMFIIEEAIQTVGMACYINYRANKLAEAREIAQWAKDNLITPAIDFADVYGYAAYPLNISYKLFYEAAAKTFDTYLSL